MARIVVVEDDRVTAALIQKRLVSFGYEVVACVASGEEAIEQTAKLQPDLVLMDIQLKGDMDGIKAAEQIRARFDIPVIYLTSDADEPTLQRAKVTEPFGYVRKPFDDREVHIALEMGLYKRRMERQRATFLAMLAHDIRNPLSVILGCAHLLKDEGVNQQHAQVVDLLERNTQTILFLVNNYLEFSKIEAAYLTLAREPIQLNDVLRDVGRQYDIEARHKRITLAFHLQEGIPTVEGDKIALERVFTNLVHNALKFTPEHGVVTVSTRLQNGGILATVTDTGLGMTLEEAALVFDQYRRGSASKPKEGMGLGLFIVKALVDAHGGRVDVESTSGQGSRFAVVLPVG